MELNPRLAALRAALGFLTLEQRELELRLLHRYADTWRGIADIVAGMACHEYDLELRRYNGQGWRALEAARPQILELVHEVLDAAAARTARRRSGGAR